MVASVKDRLKAVEYCSVTADFWSKANCKYLAVNVHYLLNDLKTNESKLIACERMTGTIDNHVIAHKLIEILENYGILNKVVAVTTDNGADFRAALTHHGDNYKSYEQYLDTREDDDHIWHGNDVDEPMDYDSDSDPIEMVPLDEFVDDTNQNFDFFERHPVQNSTHADHDDMFELHRLDNYDEIVEQIGIQQLSDDGTNQKRILPIRVSCAAHTLNLIGKTDSYKALENNDYAEQYYSVMKCLNVIWKNSSRKNSETVERYLGRQITKPHRIRWNRMYDAVSYFVLRFSI